MTHEKWIVQPGETRVIDLEKVRKLKVGLVGGQIDVVAHDEPDTRVEVHSVTVKDLRIELLGDSLEIDHPQLRWDKLLDVFRGFGEGGPKAEISVAVPRGVALSLGMVSASALVAGLRSDARLNTVSGDIMVDGLVGDLTTNAVSGDVQVRGLVGALTSNSVSGDVAVTGSLRKASVDTVSGSILVDSDGRTDSIGINTISGRSTIRLDQDMAANYAIRTVSGRVQIDGIMRSGGGPTTYTGSTGALSGSFVDVRTKSVSGDVIVLRRQPSSSSTPGLEAEEEW